MTQHIFMINLYLFFIFAGVTCPKSFNLGRTLGNRAATNDLAATASTESIVLAPVLLAAKVFTKKTVVSFVGINTLTNRFVTHWQAACKLIRTPLYLELIGHQILRCSIHLYGITARLASLPPKRFCLWGSTSVLRKAPLLIVNLS
jgi:hypothetical protein